MLFVLHCDIMSWNLRFGPHKVFPFSSYLSFTQNYFIYNVIFIFIHLSRTKFRFVVTFTVSRKYNEKNVINLFVVIEDGQFDIPDRTFHSMQTSWLLSSERSSTDVKELIPEFFYLPEFMTNYEGITLTAAGCLTAGRSYSYRYPVYSFTSTVFDAANEISSSKWNICLSLSK